MLISNQSHQPALIVLLSLFVGLSACDSLPGDGGTSTVKGKIFINEYNVSGILFDQYYATEYRVYIIYGDNAAYDDEVKTSYDGSFKFQYLRKGTYHIFAYSDCPPLTCEGNVEAKVVDVEVTDNNQVITLDDIVVDNR